MCGPWGVWCNQILVLQVQYPASYNPSVGWTSVPASPLFDSEDFEAFRGDDAVPASLFMACYGVLQTAYFDTVRPRAGRANRVWR